MKIQPAIECSQNERRSLSTDSFIAVDVQRQMNSSHSTEIFQSGQTTIKTNNNSKEQQEKNKYRNKKKCNRKKSKNYYLFKNPSDFHKLNKFSHFSTHSRDSRYTKQTNTRTKKQRIIAVKPQKSIKSKRLHTQS